MKREIKFKAKRLDNGRWVEGDFYHDENGCYIKHPYKYNNGVPNSYQSTKVDSSTVCQYTGLKDSKGQDIWEHDLIKSNDGYQEVVFKHGTFMTSYKGKVTNALIENPLVYFLSVEGFVECEVECSKFDKEV